MKKILFTVLLLSFITSSVITGRTVSVKADAGSSETVQLIQFDDVNTAGGTYSATWHSSCPISLSDCHAGLLSSDTSDKYGLDVVLTGGGPDYTVEITVNEGDPAPSSPVDVYVFMDNGIQITGTANASHEIIAETGSLINVTFDAGKCIEKILDNTETPFLLKWEVHEGIGNWFYYDSPDEIYGRMITEHELSRCGITAVSGQIEGDTVRIVPNHGIAYKMWHDLDGGPAGNYIYEPEFGEVLYDRFQFTFSYEAEQQYFDGDIFYVNGTKSINEDNVLTYSGLLSVWPELKFGTNVPNNLKVEVLVENKDTWEALSADADRKYNIDDITAQVRISADGYEDTTFLLQKNPFGLNLNIVGTGISNSITAGIKDGTAHNIKVWFFNDGTVKTRSQINTNGAIGSYQRALWVLNAYANGGEGNLNSMKEVFQSEYATSISFVCGLPNITQDYLVVAIADPNAGEAGPAFSYQTFHVTEDVRSYTAVTISTSTDTIKRITTNIVKLKDYEIKLIDVDEKAIEKISVKAEVLSDNTGMEIIGTEAKMNDSVKDAYINYATGTFEKDGKPVANQFVEDAKGSIYFTDENGKPVTDMIVTNGDRSYFFDKEGKVEKNGIITL